MRHHLLLPLLSSLALVACGQSADALDADDSAFGSLSQPIVNGEASEDPADDRVVFVHTAPDSVCSGSLIAPNLVATALHCVSDSYSGSFACNPDGTLAEPDKGLMGRLLPAEDVSIHLGHESIGSEAAAQGVRILGTNSAQICRNDIAFIVLDRPLDIPVMPVRLSYGVRVGDRLRVVGYGSREDSRTGQRYERSGVRVVDVGPAEDNTVTLSAAPRTFVVTEGPCQGDSGGPAISEETGALVGVYSLSAGSSCIATGVRNVYTALSSFSGLALQAFEAADAEPILDEPPAEPEAPERVAENACSIGHAPATGTAGTAGLVSLAALGLGLVARRRRS